MLKGGTRTTVDVEELGEGVEYQTTSIVYGWIHMWKGPSLVFYSRLCSLK